MTTPPTTPPRESETPIADSLRDHGSKYYNHPRYDAKCIKAVEKLEKELSAANAQIAELKKQLGEALLLRLKAPSPVAAAVAAEREACVEAAEEWARYVVEDNAPMKIANYIIRARSNGAGGGE